jgi:tetratricopeptide (TPR) repeat protein
VDEAAGHFEQAIRINPKNSTAHFNLGNALGAKGQLDEAIRCDEETLRLDPRNP